jgi:hypothetical protein
MGLYNVPEVIRTITSDGPWDLDFATRMIEANFKPVVDAQPAKWRLRVRPAKTGSGPAGE